MVVAEASGSAPAAAPERPGVPLTEDLIRRKAEHNEGMLSTLEEIALHQLDSRGCRSVRKEQLGTC